jgi:hypothetical protein
MVVIVVVVVMIAIMTMIMMVVIPIVVVMIVVPIVLLMLLAPVIALILAMHFPLVLLMSEHFLAEMLLTLTIVHLMARGVHVVIPPVGHEVDRASAGVIFVTVSRPVPLMARRHVQVKGRWRSRDDLSRGHGDDRPRHDELGRGDISSDCQLTVKTGSVQIDGDTHVTREGHRL